MVTPGLRVLAIDCATQALSLALIDDGLCTDHRHRLMGRGHAEALVPMIEEMLGGRRADAVAVDVGPGSFTGIRVGIAAARALGFAWGVPVTGYGCLSLCAAMVRGGIAGGEGASGGDPAAPAAILSAPITPDPITIVMTGGHGELFWQRFAAADLSPLGPLTSTPIAELARTLPDARVHGSGAALLVDTRGWGEAAECLPDARAWPLLPASHRALPPVAVYGREADAKPMAAAPAGASGVAPVAGTAA
ncbi:tRNA (adenosine(37)-N6)-threonylcarbamoyltransferase complex dimerization subunit type 1 TsaB [Sphingobium sufflavum]|uniref:tRNA (adenosine(37)-N6)-threonylcarbamoyltransferase complex dimerization subunit type 1 TsaB n=1 Tax=Sphingobium sufflavum TaxID=1129547 RepID=UPI001F37E245|nr:tRNA (adenosine(37)-N6)-threonylcarbamoyltransferase complex dimerization subunit type 1 TsaB [Sphingobium sufflavum]MCE7796300.1 tRNA (adenosine(37)-N6)-threonylcarbamoyltransferase complex dimerization subunit type 1 TsaB [Sphingobium sufflavum]